MTRYPSEHGGIMSARMTNDQNPNDESMANDRVRTANSAFGTRIGFVILVSTFVIQLSDFPRAAWSGASSILLTGMQ
jgi:hypothetical protein